MHERERVVDAHCSGAENFVRVPELTRKHAMLGSRMKSQLHLGRMSVHTPTKKKEEATAVSHI